MKETGKKELFEELTAQIRRGTAKLRNFLDTVRASALYLLFIGERAAASPPDRPPDEADEQDLLKKAAHALTRSEKSVHYLLYNTTRGLLLLTTQFELLLDCFLMLTELQSGEKNKSHGELCLGTELCITNDSSFPEDTGICAQRSMALAELAARSCLGISRAVYEVQKKNLAANKRIRIQKHGSFRLPEDKMPTDVYGLHPARGKLLYPSGFIFGRKTLTRLAAALVIGAAVVAVPLARVQVFQPTRVILRGNLPSVLYLDYKQDTPVTDIWDPEYQGYIINGDVLTGKHILSYDENTDTRYYQPFLVRHGDNPIPLHWQKTKLPYSYLWVDYTDKKQWTSNHSYKTTYIIYDRETFEPLVKDAVIELKVIVRPKEKNLLQFLFSWNITENDKTLSQGGRILDRDTQAGEAYKENTVVMSKNNYVFYHYNIYIDRRFFKFYVNSSFIEYIYLTEKK